MFRRSVSGEVNKYISLLILVPRSAAKIPLPVYLVLSFGPLVATLLCWCTRWAAGFFSGAFFLCVFLHGEKCLLLSSPFRFSSATNKCLRMAPGYVRQRNKRSTARKRSGTSSSLFLSRKGEINSTAMQQLRRSFFLSFFSFVR